MEKDLYPVWQHFPKRTQEDHQVMSAVLPLVTINSFSVRRLDGLKSVLYVPCKDDGNMLERLRSPHYRVEP